MLSANGLYRKVGERALVSKRLLFKGFLTVSTILVPWLKSSFAGFFFFALAFLKASELISFLDCSATMYRGFLIPAD